jgi:amidase
VTIGISGIPPTAADGAGYGHLVSDLAFLPALAQASLVRRGLVSPVELVETYLRRIEQLDPLLRSYVTVCPERALDEARRLEARGREGYLPPFHGVPVAVKDLTETAGIRTTFSCRALAEHVPDRDAAVVRRLRDAGMIVLGKTNTPEFGARPVTESLLNGDCRNPWDTDRTPGGSSGGSAAALAAGLCPVAHGTDGGGSIRIPASCCGLVGLKPARGRVSLAPAVGEVLEGFATSGPIARTVADAAALLDVMAGMEVGDPYWAQEPPGPFLAEVGREPGRLRIAWTGQVPLEGLDVPVDPDCLSAVASTAQLLATCGHDVEEAAPDWRDPDFVPLFTMVWQASSGLIAGIDPKQLEPMNRTLREAAAGVSSAAYVEGVVRLQLLARRIVAFWDTWDVLVTPTLALPPVPIGWTFAPDDPWREFERGWQFTGYTQIANLTGQPAVSLPLHTGVDGLPVGVQLIGRPAGEAMLIRLAAELERARPWADSRPRLAAAS